VRDTRRLDSSDLLELDLRSAKVVEEASAAAEQHGNDVELELVEEPRRQVLIDDLSAAPEHDVLAAGGFPRPFERGLDPVGDEVERRAPFISTGSRGWWVRMNTS
jgi:hypothetical protein